ncbi:unnamed protein product [Alopecurus aequalis]
MGPDVTFHLEIAAVVAVALLIVAVAVVASGRDACEGAGREEAAFGDVESALGGVTLMTYEQAATGKEKEKNTEEEEERCAICLSEYGEAGELVRVVPACGHFFHADCGVDGWLRARRTCPLCRGRLWPPQPPRMIQPLPLPLPRMTRPECPPMPPRTTSR